MASNTANPSKSNPMPVPGTMAAHFSRPREEQGSGWSELWDSDRSYLWDRGKPSPALIDLIESRPDLIPHPSGSTRKPKALVPGCGKGYDVAMLALHGYDAYGLDVSSTAMETARAYAASQLTMPSVYNFSDLANQEKYLKGEKGQAKFMVGDFFTKDWEAECRSGAGEFPGFDLIYDYTFLCALLPEMRKDWARRMRELLAPSGVLICLEFPSYKDLKQLGPPWGLREGIYWDLLAAGGNGIIDDEETAKRATDVSSGGAFKRLAYIKPVQSYEVAKGTDMLSVWALRSRG